MRASSDWPPQPELPQDLRLTSSIFQRDKSLPGPLSEIVDRIPELKLLETMLGRE